MTTGNRPTFAHLAPLLALLALLVWYGSTFREPGGRAVELVAGTLIAPPKPLPGFRLVSQGGEEVDNRFFEGSYTLLFFGYTHCPDICPTTMSLLNQVAAELKGRPEAAGATRFVFVTLDPERDTPAFLRDYLAYFNPAFEGLSGDPAEIAKVARSLGIAWMRGAETGDGGYLIDHSASILLLDPAGELVAIFSPPHRADEIAADLLTLHEASR
ncbi:MAG TPA: SCO family protein [Thiotrichales bacterium]|nr:SCO family protein [Thiotrichales bacterium]